MQQLSDVESRVLGSLDEQKLIDSLIALVRVPSVTGTAAESELQHSQAAELAGLGFDVDAWKFDLDDLSADPRFPGTEADRTEAYGVVATVGDGKPALVLQGHVDVVPTGDLDKWVDRDPFSGAIVNNILHGRGACDMKAGLAANLAVARTLAVTGVTLERAFAVHTVVSEEDGGLGAFGTMLRGHTGDAAVLSEPTSGRIVTANAGALTFKITVPGRAAHGSVRLEGVSAFEAFLPIYRRIQLLEAERNASPDRLFAETRSALRDFSWTHHRRRLVEQRARHPRRRGAHGRATRRESRRRSRAVRAGRCGGGCRRPVARRQPSCCRVDGRPVRQWTAG